jgi:alkyldihydroxyacetonephosphate synthase
MNGVTVDRASLLVEVDALTTLAQCEAALASQGLTLGLETMDRAGATKVGAWLADGAAGARDPWSDPADHLVAGLVARMKDGRTLVIRPTPRRAVGPDLIALVVGMKGRYATVERAWLRVHLAGEPRARVHALEAERNPPVSADEEKLFEEIARELGG